MSASPDDSPRRHSRRHRHRHRDGSYDDIPDVADIPGVPADDKYAAPPQDRYKPRDEDRDRDRYKPRDNEKDRYRHREDDKDRYKSRDDDKDRYQHREDDKDRYKSGGGDRDRYKSKDDDKDRDRHHSSRHHRDRNPPPKAPSVSDDSSDDDYAIIDDDSSPSPDRNRHRSRRHRHDDDEKREKRHRRDIEELHPEVEEVSTGDEADIKSRDRKRDRYKDRDRDSRDLGDKSVQFEIDEEEEDRERRKEKRDRKSRKKDEEEYKDDTEEIERDDLKEQTAANTLLNSGPAYQDYVDPYESDRSPSPRGTRRKSFGDAAYQALNLEREIERDRARKEERRQRRRSRSRSRSRDRHGGGRYDDYDDRYDDRNRDYYDPRDHSSRDKYDERDKYSDRDKYKTRDDKYSYNENDYSDDDYDDYDRHGRKSRRYKDHNGYSDYDDRSPSPRRKKSVSDAALAAIGFGAAEEKYRRDRGRGRSRSRSRSRSRARSRSRTGSIFSLSGRDRDGSRSPSRPRKEDAAKAAIFAAAIEAFRSRKAPGGLSGKDGLKRIIEAAVASGALGMLTGDSSGGGSSKSQLVQAVLGGLASERVLNGARSQSATRDSSSPHRHHKDRDRDRGSGSNESLDNLAAGGIIAAAGKALLDAHSRSKARKDDEQDKRRDKDTNGNDREGSIVSRQSSKSSRPKPARQRSLSVGDMLEAVGLGEAVDLYKKFTGKDKDKEKARAATMPIVKHGKHTGDMAELDPKRAKKLRKQERRKEVLSIALAVASTAVAANQLLGHKERNENRKELVREGRLSQQKADKMNFRSRLLQVAAIGLAVLAAGQMMRGWRKAEKRRREIIKSSHRIENGTATAGDYKQKPSKHDKLIEGNKTDKDRYLDKFGGRNSVDGAGTLSDFDSVRSGSTKQRDLLTDRGSVHGGYPAGYHTRGEPPLQPMKESVPYMKQEAFPQSHYPAPPPDYARAYARDHSVNGHSVNGHSVNGHSSPNVYPDHFSMASARFS